MSVVGRAATCHIMLKHPSVSKEHAIIEFDDKGNAFIKDMSTLNGTYINDKKMVKGSIV